MMDVKNFITISQRAYFSHYAALQDHLFSLSFKNAVWPCETIRACACACDAEIVVL